jgi:hypothetical protein
MLSVSLSAARAQEITDEQVERAIERAVEFLWSKQNADGSWAASGLEMQYPGGVTALAAFALRTAGEGVSKPGMQKAAENLEALYKKNQIQKVYSRSFAMMFWCALDPAKHRQRIREDITYLTRMQARHGAWGYGEDPEAPGGWTDHSNSQLAILALWEAANAGGEVSKKVWDQAASSWLETQNADGGWSYPATPGNPGLLLRGGSYGSMTAAGVATLYILYDQLYARSEGPYRDGAAPQCGISQARTRGIDHAIQRAWDWMNQHFITERVPAAGPDIGMARSDWLTYYLYSIERAGVASGFKYFGERPWYRSIAAELVRSQHPDGSWGGIYQSAFGLLALAKGRAVIVFNKLKYGEELAAADTKRAPKAHRAPDWNNDPRDVATLTHWIARRFETGLTWQTVELRESEDSIRDAPILYINGHEGPQWTGVEQDIIRNYVWSGGTVLAVACCNRPAFIERMSAQFDQMFPQLKRTVLPADHLVWSIHDKLTPDDSVIGYSDGCRTSIFLVTRGVCCAWQQNLFATQQREFGLGSNILLYATNRAKLRKKLAPLLPASTTLFGGKRVRIGRVRHAGDYWSDPYALRRLSDALVDRAELGIDEVPEVDLAGGKLEKLDLLFLTGHEPFTLNEHERQGLKSYLASGGTLLATSACGREPFDAAFRAVMAETFGAQALVPIPTDDALYAARGVGAGSSNLHAVHYKRPASGRKFETSDTPQLWSVRLGGRWAVIYSPLDLACGFVGHDCTDCAGYTVEDARAIGVNCVLYARRAK